MLFKSLTKTLSYIIPLLKDEIAPAAMQILLHAVNKKQLVCVK